MKRKYAQLTGEESIQDSAYDLLGEMILEVEADEVMRELQEESRSGQSGEMDAFFRKNDSVYLKQIEKACKRARRRQRNEAILGRMTQIAALIIIGVFVLGSVTIAASEDVRVQLMKLLSWTTDSYMNLELVPSYETVNIPEAWQGDYYPEYIPTELSLAQCLPDTVTYWKDGDIAVSVRFCEYTETTHVNLDAENAEMIPVTVQDMPAQMIRKEHRIVIYWVVEDRFFTVTTKGYDGNTALRVANSVKRIK